MSTAVNPVPLSGEQLRRSYRAPIVIGLLLLGIMIAVWWSFFALRNDQSVRVLFSAGAYSQETPGDESRAAGTTLKTGDDGFVTVRLSDGSIVKLMPNTHLDIEDARANSQNDRFTTSLRMISGEIETQVERGDGANRTLNLFSDSVAIGVRGTVFGVIQDDGQARLMVTRGRVEAQGEVGDGAIVNANEGTLIKTGTAVEQVVQLPAAPERREDVRIVSEGLAFDWRESQTQPGYQIEIALDDAFNKLLKREKVQWQLGTLAPVPRDGRYFWRVASIDANGLRGAFSDGAAFEQDYFLRRSRAALEAGDVAAVRENLAFADKAIDEEIDRLRVRALQASAQRRFDDAKRDLNTVLALRPADAKARNLLANAQFRLLDYSAARKSFNATVELAGDKAGVSPEDATDAQAGLALIDVREGQFAAAMTRLDNVLAANPQHVTALGVAAMASVGLGERKRADEYIERVLARQPDNAAALSLRKSLQSEPPRFPEMKPESTAPASQGGQPS